MKWLKVFSTFLMCCCFGSSFANPVLGTVDFTSSKQTVSIGSFTDPIIILGVPSLNDADAGVASVSNVTSSSFDIQFKNWPYIGGTHEQETVSYMVIERGRHVMVDGSIWEAESFTQNQGNKNIFFLDEFPHAPKLLITPQTQNEAEAFVSRAWSVTNKSFSANLSEQENAAGHGNESIGYLAIYSSENSGNIGGGSLYTLKSEAINETGYSTFLGKILVQEEQSSDTEVAHALEVLSILTFENHIFASDNSRYGADTMSLRLEPFAASALVLTPGERTGTNGNIALLGSNGLTQASYTASNTYSSDTPAGGFDGYNSSTLINSDSSGKKNRGIWLSLYGYNEQWLQVAFEQQAYITGFAVFLYSAGSTPGMGVKDMTIQVSDDNVIFRDHESFSLVKSLEQHVTLSEPAIGKYIRLVSHNTQGHSYVDIGELEYYGSFVTSGELPPEEEPTPLPTNNTTCATIKANSSTAASGIYQVDPDGDGGLAPFDAYCEMDLQGGGWMLVANHGDGLTAIVESEVVNTTSFSVLPDNKWQAIMNNMSTGMMFVDEHNQISTLNKAHLVNGNCQSISDTQSLSTPPVPYDTGLIWQSEGSGCSLTGLDYSFIGLSIQSTSRGSNYLTIGAALYQHNTKFDIWPYSDVRYSGAEQNELLYYVK